MRTAKSGSRTRARKVLAVLLDPGRVKIPAKKHPGKRTAPLWVVLVSVYNAVIANRIPSFAAGVAFFSLMALFPAITAFISIYGLFADPKTVATHISAMHGFLPQGTLSVIEGQINRVQETGAGSLSTAFIISLVYALWSANAGTKAIIESLNITYGQREHRSFFRLNLETLMLTLGSMAMLALLLFAMAVVPAILSMLPEKLQPPGFLAHSRWPLIFMVLMVALMILYQFGPSRKHVAWKYVFPGSLVASISLLGFSMLFSWYVSSFGSYNRLYGSVGALIAFMVWLWLAVMIILVCAQLNSRLERAHGIHVPGG